MFSYSHYPMLKCRVRMRAYRKAIHAVVKDGDVVADLGTGTGILSYWAVEAGAKKVYAVDQNSVIDSAREIARLNGMEDRIVFLRGDSREIELPRKADVLVSELLASFGIEDGVVEVVADARERWLKKNHRMIPRGFSLYAAPVESTPAFDKISFWDNVSGYRYAPIKACMVNSVWVEQFKRQELLAKPVKIKEVDLSLENETHLNRTIAFTASRKGLLHGFCGFFRARLADGVSFSTSPTASATHWNQMFFPTPEQLRLAVGDKIIFRISTSRAAGRIHFNWMAEVCRGKRHIELPGSSTLLGLLDSLKDLQKLSNR